MEESRIATLLRSITLAPKSQDNSEHIGHGLIASAIGSAAESFQMISSFTGLGIMQATLVVLILAS